MHLLVDTCLRQSPPPMSIRQGLKQVLTRWMPTRLRKLWADLLPRRGHPNVRKKTTDDLEIVAKQGGGFTVLKAWVVERTLAWLMNFRRLPETMRY